MLTRGAPALLAGLAGLVPAGSGSPLVLPMLGARRSPGARTGVGTYINYLLAASVVAGSVLAGALAAARRRAGSRPEVGAPRPKEDASSQASGGPDAEAGS